jgi:signal transduction histidine kinase
MPVGSSAYALLGLTVVVGVLAAALTFAILRLSAAARDTRRHLRGGAETALLSAALEEAVTKLKAQERATAARADASERLSEEIITSLTAGLLVVGLDREVRVLNRAGRRLLHVPESGPLTGRHDYRQLLGQTPLADTIEECLATGVPAIRRSIQLSGAELGTTHFGVTVSPLFDDQSALHGAICLFSDLTAIKELEEQLRLKESLAAVGELTAGIAHEFRNGLATIHGYSKLIDVKTLPETYRKYIEAIRLESDVLSQMVTNFLSFATPAKLTLTRVDLRAICDRAAEEMAVEARSLGGDVTVRGDFAPVEGDEVLLRQAFSNLLRNAVEACAGGSLAPVVVVRSEIHPAQHVSHIVVEDNGPGIRPEERERVFRPFVTSKRHGTGLGLAIVQKIVVFHNGRITVGTSPLGGASFQIVLPIESQGQTPV